MEKLVRSVQQSLQGNGISTDNSRLLLACSGGIDSMCLLHSLLELHLNPTIAHCNFGLRKESDQDEDFVKKEAQRLNLKCFTKKFKTEDYARSNRISIQMAARNLRYNWFDQLMQEHDFQFLLTAHHLDDSIETILINLFRGTGLSGLRGITSRSSVLRPLLSVKKSEIITYATNKNIRWHEDSSNCEDKYQRNFIRNQIVPQLAKNIPGFHSGIKTSIKNFGSDYEIFDYWMKATLEELVTNLDSEVRLDVQKLRSRKGSRSILSYWLNQYGSWDLEAILQSLDSGSGKKFNSEKYELLLNRDQLILRRKTINISDNFTINLEEQSIKEPVKLSLEIAKSETFIIPKDANSAALDFDKLEFPLIIRKWQKGDSFMPLGMKNFKKLSDFFIDEKLSLFDKTDVWLMCSGKDIVWVVGYRIDERFKLRDNTKTVYFARLLKEEQ